jgi:hypothetical protein
MAAVGSSREEGDSNRHREAPSSCPVGQQSQPNLGARSASADAAAASAVNTSNYKLQALSRCLNVVDRFIDLIGFR